MTDGQTPMHEKSPQEVIEDAVAFLVEHELLLLQANLNHAVRPAMEVWLDEDRDEALDLLRLVQKFAIDYPD